MSVSQLLLVVVVMMVVGGGFQFKKYRRLIAVTQ